jgi:hypothetical protein
MSKPIIKFYSDDKVLEFKPDINNNIFDFLAIIAENLTFFGYHSASCQEASNNLKIISRELQEKLIECDGD